MNVLSIRSWRETRRAHLSSPRCTTSVYWIGELWVVTGYVTYKGRMRFRKEEIQGEESRSTVAFVSSTNVIVYSSTSKSHYRASQIHTWYFCWIRCKTFTIAREFRELKGLVENYPIFRNFREKALNTMDILSTFRRFDVLYNALIWPWSSFPT